MLYCYNFYAACRVSVASREMAREEWGGAGAKEVASKEQGAAGDRGQGKTVRFVTRDAICDNRVKRVEATGVNMVQSLVPHLPGLDKDKVYVISGETLL